MITFAPTTSHKLRLGANATAEEKEMHLDRLRDGLHAIDARSTKVTVGDLAGQRLAHDGSLGGVRFTKEGFASFCSRLSPNLQGVITGLDGADMGAEARADLQTDIFNRIWTARGHELEDFSLLVDSNGNKAEAIHSPSYGHVSNVDALDMMIDNKGTEESLEYYTLRGRRLDVGISDPSKKIAPRTKRSPDGEDITAIKYLQNSEDSSLRFQFGIGLYTLICTNGMRIGKEYTIASAIHRSGILESISRQLRNIQNHDLSEVFGKVEGATQIMLDEEIQARSKRFLEARLPKKEVTDLVTERASFDGQSIPTVYEVFSAITEGAHAGGHDLVQQVKREEVAFQYMNAMVA
jgi:hypothetical protein